MAENLGFVRSNAAARDAQSEINIAPFFALHDRKRATKKPLEFLRQLLIHVSQRYLKPTYQMWDSQAAK